jgi:hypothetical protein
MRLAALVLLAGCPGAWCPEGEITRGPADQRVRPGDAFDLHAEDGGDWESDAEHCGGHWYVNSVLGGTSEVGTVDPCGRYRAPAAFPDGLALVHIEAADFVVYPFSCADCCAVASLALEPVR